MSAPVFASASQSAHRPGTSKDLRHRTGYTIGWRENCLRLLMFSAPHLHLALTGATAAWIHKNVNARVPLTGETDPRHNLVKAPLYTLELADVLRAGREANLRVPRIRMRVQRKLAHATTEPWRSVAAQSCSESRPPFQMMESLFVKAAELKRFQSHPLAQQSIR